ncbi:MAG: ribosome maturation factor RimP [bacterium]|jgi:ribosome maturation factor RimP|nr:ribosome maturation factor RimP [bacterium]MDD4152685.1 ribosome maturation factor RimP [bacterium]
MKLVERLEAIIEPILARENYELVDIEFVRAGRHSYLRLFVDKDGGVTLDDCEHISCTVGAYLDESDLMTEAYHLEVSSPGLDRVIKKEKDFRRFAGRKASITTFYPIEDRRKFNGMLKGLKEGKVLIEVEDVVYVIPLEDISKTRLVADI